MSYEDYVSENVDFLNINDRDIYFLNSKKCLYSYEDLLYTTINDIEEKTVK